MRQSDIIFVDGPDYYGFTYRNCAGQYVAVDSLTNSSRGGLKTLPEAVQYLINKFESFNA